MKKNIIRRMLVSIMMLTMMLLCVGCAGSSKQNEEKKQDISKYVGVWKGLKGGDSIELREDGSVADPNRKVMYSYIWSIDNGYLIIDDEKYTYTTIFDKEALKCEDNDNVYYVREEGYKEIKDDAYVTKEINVNDIWDYIDFTTIELSDTHDGGYKYNFKFKSDKDGYKYIYSDSNIEIGYSSLALGGRQDIDTYFRLDNGEGYFILKCPKGVAADIEEVKKSLNVRFTDNMGAMATMKDTIYLTCIKNEYYDVFY